MRSAAKRNRRKSQREAARERRQRDPEPATEDEDLEIAFPHIQPAMVLPDSPSSSPPASPASPGELDYGVVLDMVQKNSRLGDMNLDTERIRSVCDRLLRDYRDRDAAICNLPRLVKETLDRPASHQPHRDAVTPHPIVRPDLIDDEGNLRAADIGITWQGSDTFLHGVKVVGPNTTKPPLRPRTATSTPYVPAWEHVCVTCQRHHRCNRHAWRSLTDRYTGTHRRVVRVNDRPPRSSASITRA